MKMPHPNRVFEISIFQYTAILLLWECSLSGKTENYEAQMQEEK